MQYTYRGNQTVAQFANSQAWLYLIASLTPQAVAVLSQSRLVSPVTVTCGYHPSSVSTTTSGSALIIK